MQLVEDKVQLAVLIEEQRRRSVIDYLEPV
jgi:hypothetical protein